MLTYKNKESARQSSESVTARIRKEQARYIPNTSEDLIPNEDQWKKIRIWEDEHSIHMHPVHRIDPPTKYIKNQPYFRYELYGNHLGEEILSATCLTCARKAFRRSLGIVWLYEKLCKKYDATYYAVV
ncbi:MAG: hypothetical protein K6G10_01560 [Butyrivibrio sp.]|nr:hypothetical protein [Butyrivibrio sp.]